MKSERFDIHQHITDQIIAAIERGAGEFRLPWHRASGNIMRPVNIASKNSYRGVNILTLWATADDKGFTSGTWGTYKQWGEAGAQVRKGEKAAYVVFYKQVTVDDEESNEAETRLFAAPRRSLLRNRSMASPLPSSKRPRRSSRRSSRPKHSSSTPVLRSITARAALSTVPPPTASNYRHARPSSAPRPARRPRATTQPCCTS
jgi:hypothetical protein